MKAEATALPGVLVLEPRVFGDERGYLFEGFNSRTFAEVLGRAAPQFVLDIHSSSVQGVVRGLHYQIDRPQAKLICVVEGEVFDVAIDLRRSSPTFGKWTGVVLSATNQRQIWIPEGFGHGFCALSPTARLLYKNTDHYSAAGQRTVLWNDPDIGIRWPLPDGVEPMLAPKDAAAPRLRDAEVFD